MPGGVQCLFSLAAAAAWLRQAAACRRVDGLALRSRSRSRPGLRRRRLGRRGRGGRLRVGRLRPVPRDRQAFWPVRTGRIRVLRQSLPLVPGCLLPASGGNPAGPARRLRLGRPEGRPVGLSACAACRLCGLPTVRPVGCSAWCGAVLPGMATFPPGRSLCRTSHPGSGLTTSSGDRTVMGSMSILISECRRCLV
jgi:hypothetical protein